MARPSACRTTASDASEANSFAPGVTSRRHDAGRRSAARRESARAPRKRRTRRASPPEAPLGRRPRNGSWSSCRPRRYRSAGRRRHFHETSHHGAAHSARAGTIRSNSARRSFNPFSATPRTCLADSPSGVGFPKNEREVASLVSSAARVLPIGAQSSLTGGATPRGDLLISTRALVEIGTPADGVVQVDAGVPLAELQRTLAASGLYYPPVPTFDGAFVGGTISTNAAGAATFKYGSVRRWVAGAARGARRRIDARASQGRGDGITRRLVRARKDRRAKSSACRCLPT